MPKSKTRKNRKKRNHKLKSVVFQLKQLQRKQSKKLSSTPEKDFLKTQLKEKKQISLNLE